VHIAVDEVEQTLGIDFNVDTSSGIVTFIAGHIPPNGTLVTAGFEFDVPARFNTDFLNINLSAFQAGEIPDIPIIEVKI
jgi:uncharacterized protein (TIGR02217 family)